MLKDLWKEANQVGRKMNNTMESCCGKAGEGHRWVWANPAPCSQRALAHMWGPENGFLNLSVTGLRTNWFTLFLLKMEPHLKKNSSIVLMLSKTFF